MNRLGTIGVILILAASGCTASIPLGTETPTPTISPTPTPSEASSAGTAVPTPTPEPTQTYVPPPSYSPPPTLSPSPTPTPAPAEFIISTLQYIEQIPVGETVTITFSVNNIGERPGPLNATLEYQYDRDAHKRWRAIETYNDSIPPNPDKKTFYEARLTLDSTGLYRFRLTNVDMDVFEIRACKPPYC